MPQKRASPCCLPQICRQKGSASEVKKTITFTGIMSLCRSVLHKEMQNNTTGRAICSRQSPNKCFFSLLEKKVIGVSLVYLKKKMKALHLLLLARVLDPTAIQKNKASPWKSCRRLGEHSWDCIICFAYWRSHSLAHTLWMDLDMWTGGREARLKCWVRF